MLAIGQYWQPQITEDSIAEAHGATEEFEDGTEDATSIDSMASAGAQDLEDRSATTHDDMPLLKAHGTKHAAAGSSSVLQDSKKQENIKPDRLVNGQTLAPQHKIAGKAEALNLASAASVKAAHSSGI